MKRILKYSDSIFGMSFPKKVCETKLKGQSKPIVEHIGKIILYKNTYPQYVNGWINDISKAIHNASKIESKGGKLKVKDYENNLFIFLGDNTHRDADATLSDIEFYESHKNKNPMDEIDITDDMIDSMVNIGNSMKLEISKLLANTNEEIPIPDIVPVVKSIFHIV